MEIFVKDFSRTALPRILKFGTSDMTNCTVYKNSATYCLSVPLFVHFSFFPIKIDMACDGYCREYVSFAHFLLYFDSGKNAFKEDIIDLITTTPMTLETLERKN